MSKQQQLIAGKYQATPTALADGGVGAVLVDAQGRIVVSPGGGGGDVPSLMRFASFDAGIVDMSGWVAGGPNVAPTFLSTSGDFEQFIYGTADQWGSLVMVDAPRRPTDTYYDPDLVMYTDDDVIIVSEFPAYLQAFDVVNEGASGYLQILAQSTAPLGGEQPSMVWRVPAADEGGAVYLTRSRGQLAGGKLFDPGLVVVWSSTKDEYTQADFVGSIAVFWT